MPPPNNSAISFRELPYSELIKRDRRLAELRRKYAQCTAEERREAADWAYDDSIASRLFNQGLALAGQESPVQEPWPEGIAAPAIDPTYAPAMLTVGSIEYQLGRRDEATIFFHGLLKLPTDTPELEVIMDKNWTSGSEYVPAVGIPRNLRERIGRRAVRLSVVSKDESPHFLWHGRAVLVRTRAAGASGSSEKGTSMKTTSWVITLLVGLWTISTYGQAAKKSQTPPVIQSVTNKEQNPAPDGSALRQSHSVKHSEEQPKAVAVSPTAATNVVLRTHVVYGGYATDLLKAKKRKALFDLRKPLDPQKDLENVLPYPGAEKVHGLDPYTSPVVILFSIKH